MLYDRWVWEYNSPYRPGAGRNPAVLAGRDNELKTWITSLQRIEHGNDSPPLALYGLRGVGKTVLLNYFKEEAKKRDWLVVKVEAISTKSLRELLISKLYPELKKLVRPHVSTSILQAIKTALSFKATLTTSGNWQFGVDLTNTHDGAADTGVIETDLIELFRDLSLAVAEEQGTGLAVLIDEAQDLASEDLEAISVAMHEAMQEGHPIALALSGLPNLPAKLAEAKSYTERLFRFMPIDSLYEHEAKSALNIPSAKHNVYWTNEALDFVILKAAGYPYFLQAFGAQTWIAAPPKEVIELESARSGVQSGLKYLDEGFFKSRWDRATNAEKEFLRAMAADGDSGSRTLDVADRLSKTQQSIGPLRAGLIAKGLIYAPEHGRVQFTVPAMSGFIQRQGNRD